MALTDLLKKLEQKGGGYKITDANGRNMTVNKEALDGNGLADYIDKNGNIYDTRNRPSNAGRRYKEDDSVWQAPEDRMNKTGKSINRVTNGNDTVSKLRGAITRGNVARNIQSGAANIQGVAAPNQNIANNPNAIDLSTMYTQYKGGNFDAMKQAAQASLKSALSKLNPMRNSVDLGKEQLLSRMRESLANQGDKGGIGRQDMLGVNTSAENQQNNIDLQEQDTINTTQADLLRQLIAENNRQEGIDIDESRYQDDRSRYEQERADEQSRYEDERSDIVQDREAEAADKALKSEIETMGRYYTDFQAEINRRTNSGDKSDDALIPYLQAARAEKIAKQLADADNSASQAYKNAYNMWLQLGVATPEVARILGIEAGAKTLDKVKAEYSTSKPYYNPNTGGGSSGNGLSW
jgi:hypothetical protein